MADLYCAYNTWARWNANNPPNSGTLSANFPSPAAPGPGNTTGKSAILYNIAGALSNNKTSAVVDKGNVILGQNGALIPYSSVFASPASSPTTLAATVTAFTPIGSFVGKGAANAGHIDYINRTRNRAFEESFLNFDPLGNQTTNTAVTSNWCRLLGGPDSQAFSIVGGTVEWADDALGTNTTGPVTSGTVSRGKFARIHATTSTGGSTTVTATLTVNGTAFAFNITTQSVASFVTVDNQVTAFSTMPTPSPTESGLKRFLIAVRAKHDNAPAAGACVFSDNSGVTKLDLATATTYRFQLTSGAVLHKSNLAPATGSWETHLFAVDLTQTSAAAVSKWFADQGSGFANVPQVSSTIDTSGALSRTSVQLFASTLGLFGKPGGTNIIDGEMAFFWMHWGDATFTLPDISDPTVQNLFTADRINLTNGSGPLGFQPKLFFYGASGATDWNAGLANKGTESLTMTKQAGTYA